MEDLISRQAAINALKNALMSWSYMPEWRDAKLIEALMQVPSTQPHSNELSKTQMSLDCISRQAAIDSFKADDDGSRWSVEDIIYRLEQFPSAEEMP